MRRIIATGRSARCSSDFVDTTGQTRHNACFPAIVVEHREAQAMSFANDPLRSDPLARQPLPTDPNTSLTPDELQWGPLCHFAGALPVPPFIGPSLCSGICWLLKKDTSPWVDEQGKKALNFHLTNLLFMAAPL